MTERPEYALPTADACGLQGGRRHFDRRNFGNRHHNALSFRFHSAGDRMN
jgi:hypothetical protein